MMVYFKLIMVNFSLMMVKCSSMMVKWLYDHTLILPSLTTISPSLTTISPSLISIIPSIAWSKPSFAHLTIIEQLYPDWKRKQWKSMRIDVSILLWVIIISTYNHKPYKKVVLFGNLVQWAQLLYAIEKS